MKQGRMEERSKEGREWENQMKNRGEEGRKRKERKGRKAAGGGLRISGNYTGRHGWEELKTYKVNGKVEEQERSAGEREWGIQNDRF